MKEFQQKKKIKNITHSRYVVFVLVFFIFILLSSVVDLYQKKQRVLKFQNESKIELARMSQKNAELNTDIETLSTERGRESLIRQKYNVKTPGEGVIVVTTEEIKGEGIAAVKTDFWYTITHIFDGFLRK
jgi:cell division protein FtsB